MRPTALLALACVFAPIMAAETAPAPQLGGDQPGASAASSAVVPEASVSVPVNTIDPLTGLSIDPGVGTITILLDLDRAVGVDNGQGPRRPICIGFSSAESREAVRSADPAMQQEYARAAMADKTIATTAATAR